MDFKGNHLLSEIENIENQTLEILIQATDTVRYQDVSNYPILIAHSVEYEFEIGIKLDIPHERLEFRMSTLEELYVKNLVLKDNLDKFRNLYLSKKDKLCFLGLTENSQEFIFMSAITQTY
jgi:hypothetical protein